MSVIATEFLNRIMKDFNFLYFTRRIDKYDFFKHLFLKKKNILQTRRICLPYKTENRPIIGRVLVATRTIKPMELILIDPGTVIGPNYTSKPTCLECLRLVDG